MMCFAKVSLFEWFITLYVSPLHCVNRRKCSRDTVYIRIILFFQQCCFYSICFGRP